MSTKLFIGIAVRDALGMQALPGVWKSVADMSAWAVQAGYASVVVTDDGGTPVTVERIAAAVKAQLQAGLDRIILYFAGHGFWVPPDQYLILSAGPEVPRQRITRNGFRDMLATYAPKQVSVIIDACQSMRPFVGLADSVLDPSGAEFARPKFDEFYAAQQGAQAFAFHATPNQPELCVFSWVLHRGLTFENIEAATPDGSRVTSSSLADYLDRAVPAEAAARAVWQQPITNTGFRPPNDVYAEQARRSARTPPPTPGSKSVMRSPGPAALQRPREDLRRRIVSEWRAPFQEWASSNSRPLSSLPPVDLMIDFTGENVLINRHTVVSGGYASGGPRGRWLSPFESPGDLHAGLRRAVSVGNTDGWLYAPNERSSTLLVTVDDYSVLVPMHRGLWCALRMSPDRDDGQVTDVLTWGSRYRNPNRDESLSPLEVLKGLLLGRIRSDDIPEIAASVRVGKHHDPLLGIVAAYLYDSIGDVENNRRMCWYYHYHEQDVPFDIALLARAPIERTPRGFVIHVPGTKPVAGTGPEFTREATPAQTVGIAGIAPVLRAGWAQMQTLQDGLHKELAALADELTSDAIATFRGDHAREELTRIVETLGG